MVVEMWGDWGLLWKGVFPHCRHIFIAFLFLQLQESLFQLQYLCISSEIDEKSNLSQFSNWPCSGVISHSNSCLYMQDLSLLVRWNFARRQLWWIWPQVLLAGLYNDQEDAQIQVLWRKFSSSRDQVGKQHLHCPEIVLASTLELLCFQNTSWSSLKGFGHNLWIQPKIRESKSGKRCHLLLCHCHFSARLSLTRWGWWDLWNKNSMCTLPKEQHQDTTALLRDTLLCPLVYLRLKNVSFGAAWGRLDCF